MNQEQAKSAARTILAVIGGFIVHAGWIKADALTALLSNEALLGGIGSLGILIWGLIAHTQANAVAVVDTIAKDPASAVKGIVTTNSAEGVALSQSLPGGETVPAGSSQAAQIAKQGT